MSNSTFLINEAVRDVWCNPRQDFQHIFLPTRITDERGVMNFFDMPWRTIQLPTPVDKYHVYEIGQINPAALGLTATQGAWTNLSTVMQLRKVFIQIYTTEGQLFPLTESYIMFTRDRDLILAVKEQPTIAPLRTTPLYFRFYSNAYFASARSLPSLNMLSVRFYRHTTVVNALAFQNLVSTFMAKPGYTALTVNGATVGGFLPMALAVGDVLEMTYDSSVKKVVDFPLASLPSFDSILDAKRKYLLHYTGAQANNNITIDYRDDCDLYLVKPSPTVPSNPFTGVIFHKNQDDAMRQVTHRDYSVAIPYVAAYLTSQPTWGSVNELSMRLVIRNAGYSRPLVFESNLINELYKLPEPDLSNAFLGIDSTVDVWRAPNLENSDYIKLMGEEFPGITLDLVENAFGYNSISRMIGDTPQFAPANQQYLKLPPGLWTNATMYEYDADGLLIGHYPHVSGAEYAPVYPGTALIEGLVGTGQMQLDMVFNQQDVPLDPTLSYRFYTAPILNGAPIADQWRDVTEDTSVVMVVNGKVHWLNDLNQNAVVVKSDKNFLAYDLTLSPENGLMQFSIQAAMSTPTGVVTQVLDIPVGQLDLWLNSNALIENIDYYVQWPQVVLVNKTFLNTAGLAQKITVRGTGFCLSDLSRLVPDETNFLKWGAMSHNDRFNIRDDKVIRIIANGRTLHRSQVVFSEDQIEALVPIVPNGSPYQVTDVIVPLRNFTDQDTYTMRAAAVIVDQAVSDYLTLKLPDKDPTDVDIVPQKYAVYSPFSSTILYDMINGIISMTPFMGQYSDKDVKDALQRYVYLLQYDPTQRGFDALHVDVQPHNSFNVIEVTIYQYMLLARAIQLFLNNAVDLSRFVSIAPVAEIA